jgi:hypothetical protein
MVDGVSIVLIVAEPSGRLVLNGRLFILNGTPPEMVRGDALVHRESIWRRLLTLGSRKIGDCPSDDDLICLGTPERSSKKSRRIRRHVDRCPSCQAYLRDLGEIFQVLDIVVAMDNEDCHEQRDRQTADFRRVLHERTRPRPESSLTLKRVLPVVAAVLLAMILPTLIVRATQYDAGTVVQRAADHERSEDLAEDADEPLRFRWVPEDKRDVGLAKLSAAGKTRRRTSSSVTGTEPTREIVLLLDSHGFNRQEPLSASRLAAWSSSRSVHEHRVVLRDGLLYVRMTVPHGELREVVVVVRKSDWRVVGQSWLFSDLGRLQVDRLGSDVFSPRSRLRAPHSEGAAQ